VHTVEALRAPTSSTDPTDEPVTEPSLADVVATATAAAPQPNTLVPALKKAALPTKTTPTTTGPRAIAAQMRPADSAPTATAAAVNYPAMNAVQLNAIIDACV